MVKVSMVPALQPQQDSAGAIVPMSGVGAIPLDTSEWNATIGGSIDSVRKEIDEAFADMATFHNREPDEIMRMTRGHSARLSEIRVRILRIEDYRREWKNIRTREIEPTLEELTVQWQNASRLHSVRELDWKMEMGQS